MRLVLFMMPLVLASCGFQSNGFFPGPFFARDFPPPGPPNYQQGMTDGCKTALGAVGSSLYGMLYNSVYYDVDKALNDEVYYKAWKDGYFYCKYEFDKGPE
jgi:hypothetical protein